jgi:phosphate transport system substrate-binding protein
MQTASTGGGFKLFCEGLGAESPDIAMAVRQMKPAEKEACKKNGVEFVEVKLGYDAVVMAQSNTAPAMALTRKDIRNATGMWALKDGKIAQNTARTWKDVNPALPATKVEIHGPSNTSGFYDTFVEMLAASECKAPVWSGSADTSRKCRILRDPGVYVVDPIDSSAAVGQLAASPDIIGLVDFKTAEDNAKKIQAIPIDGVEPSYANIQSSAYPGTQPLLLYVKTASIGAIPGLKDYVAEFASENAISEKGYLKSLGLVSLPPDLRAAGREELKGYGISPSTAVAAASSKGGKASGKGKKK